MNGITRPTAEVLPESAVVPHRNVMSPAPDHFTHEVTSRQPYWYSEAGANPPDGEFAAGTKVLMTHAEGPHAWVADSRGLYVKTNLATLRPLS
jgi:hypothetical protein